MFLLLFYCFESLKINVLNWGFSLTMIIFLFGKVEKKVTRLFCRCFVPDLFFLVNQENVKNVLETKRKNQKKNFFLNLQENVSINKYRISLFNLYLKNSDCIST